MSPLRIALVFVAIAAAASQDAVMPEQEFDETFSDEDELTAFIQQNTERSKTDPDGALKSLTNMMQATPKRDLSKLKATISDLINDVKKEHAKDKTDSQAKVNKNGAALQACANKKETSQSHKAAVAADQQKQDNAESHAKKKSTGVMNYNLGDRTTSSTAAVAYVNTEMKRIKKEFDNLIRIRSAARNALKGSQAALKAANAALVDNKHQCFCINKKSFNANFKSLDDNTQHNHELAHFHTVHCLVKEYEKGNFHNKGLENCKGEYDKLSKTKGLDKSSGTVNDSRFTDCGKFSEQKPTKAPSYTKAPSKFVKWGICPQTRVLCSVKHTPTPAEYESCKKRAQEQCDKDNTCPGYTVKKKGGNVYLTYSTKKASKNCFANNTYEDVHWDLYTKQ